MGRPGRRGGPSKKRLIEIRLFSRHPVLSNDRSDAHPLPDHAPGAPGQSTQRLSADALRSGVGAARVRTWRDVPCTERTCTRSTTRARSRSSPRPRHGPTRAGQQLPSGHGRWIEMPRFRVTSARGCQSDTAPCSTSRSASDRASRAAAFVSQTLHRHSQGEVARFHRHSSPSAVHTRRSSAVVMVTSPRRHDQRRVQPRHDFVEMLHPCRRNDPLPPRRDRPTPSAAVAASRPGLKSGLGSGRIPRWADQQPCRPG